MTTAVRDSQYCVGSKIDDQINSVGGVAPSAPLGWIYRDAYVYYKFQQSDNKAKSRKRSYMTNRQVSVTCDSTGTFVSITSTTEKY